MTISSKKAPPVGIDTIQSPETVGKNVRKFRKKHRMTLEGLSAKTGISVSSLSRIENTRLSLNIEKLNLLAAAFSVRPENLLPAHDSEIPKTSKGVNDCRHAIDRGRTRLALPAGEIDASYLFQEIESRKLDMIIINAKPISIWDSEFIKHPGEKVLYVIAGEMLLYIENSAPFVLEEGDAMFLDSPLWHSMAAVGDRAAQVLVVYYYGTGEQPPIDVRRFTAEEWRGPL